MYITAQCTYVPSLVLKWSHPTEHMSQTPSLGLNNSALWETFWIRIQKAKSAEDFPKWTENLSYKFNIFKISFFPNIKTGKSNYKLAKNRLLSRKFFVLQFRFISGRLFTSLVRISDHYNRYRNADPQSTSVFGTVVYYGPYQA